MPDEFNLSGHQFFNSGEYNHREHWGSAIEIDNPSIYDMYNGLTPFAFKNCTSLSSIIIPSNTKGIFWNVFYNCPSLEKIIIPEDITVIGENAFFYCENLKNIYCYAIEPPTIEVSTFYNINENCVLRVPAESVEKYKAAKYWQKFANIVGLTTPVSSITLNEEKLDLPINGMYTLTATVLPLDATDKSITWASSNPANVMVLTNGMVIALNGEGAIITATANDGSGVVATCYVNMVKTYNLADGTAYDNDEQEEYDEINYTRSFSNTNLQALYVPFAMEYNDWSDKADIYRIKNIFENDANDDGNVDEWVMRVIKLGVGSSTKPNTPYLIKPKATGDMTLQTSLPTLYPAEKKNVWCASTDYSFYFTGTYQPMTVHADTYFALSGGALSYTTSDVALKAQRWYMEIRDKETGDLVPPLVFNNTNEAKSIRIFVEGEDDATSIHPIIKNESEQEAVIYNLNGQRISATKKGIYIINGKKIMAK